MNKQQLYLACALYPPTQSQLKNTYDIYNLRDALILTDIPECEVLVTTSLSEIDGATLAKLPSVKLIANFGTGVDLIDLKYCAEHNIAVTNTPGTMTEDVADLTLALILATLRQVVSADRFVRQGLWQEQMFALTRSIRGLNIGIIGMGQIGKEIARLCSAFKTEIGYYGPNRKPVVYSYYPEIEQLAEWADVLIAACPGGESTQGLVSASVLDRLGPQGFFINIARGSVVDQQALVNALLTGGIAGAGLDVYVNEPNIPKQLLNLDNVVLQPHHGSATDRSRMEMGNLTLANIAAYFAGQPLPTPVNLQRLL